MVENIHKLLYQWITLYACTCLQTYKNTHLNLHVELLMSSVLLSLSGVVVLLLIIAVSETVVPLETKALPVKNTCPPVDFSKRQKTG